jgi:hypothetical protein
MAANRFDQLIDRFEPVLRKAFLDAVTSMRGRVDIGRLTAMLERRDVEGALKAVGLDPVSFRVFDRAFTEAYETGGVVTAKSVPVTRGADGFRTVFQFNIRNPQAEDFLRRHSSTLIRDVMDDQRQMIRSYLRNGLEQGANPRTTALDLAGRINKATGRREGGVIGLTSSQEEWLRNYEAKLKSDSPSSALELKLRDKRFDGAVKRAAAEGKPIEPGLRDKMVTAYRNRALRYRAETIARSETMTALHEAQEQSMGQGILSGAVQADVVEGIWRVAKPRGKNARESHTPMDGQVAKFGHDFTTGNGVKMRYPGDPRAPVSETASCRCWREIKIDFLAGVR